MGQAKQRGTFEQRKAEGLVKRREQERKRVEYEASIPAEERNRRQRTGLLLALASALIAR
jgi:hypothetical protein